jgi:hypothetical protein
MSGPDPCKLASGPERSGANDDDVCPLPVYETPSITVTPLHKVVRGSFPGSGDDGAYGFNISS